MKTTHLKVFTLGIALISSMGIWGSDEAVETFTETSINDRTLRLLVSHPERERYIRTSTTQVEQSDGSFREEQVVEVTLPKSIQQIQQWDFAVLNPTLIQTAKGSRLWEISSRAFGIPIYKPKIKKEKIRLQCLDFSQSPFLFGIDANITYLPVPVRVVLPLNTTKLGLNMFKNSKLSSLRNIDAVDEIGYWCFHQCSMPRDFCLPPQLTCIQAESFFKAKFPNMSLEIPAAVTSLERLAFAEVKGLKRISGGLGLTKINGSAFSENPSLESLIIDNQRPATVSYSENAKKGLLHSGCTNLKCLCFSGPVVFDRADLYDRRRFYCDDSKDCWQLRLVQITDQTLRSLNTCDPSWWKTIDDDASIFVSRT